MTEEEYVEVRVPVKLATELYVKGTMAKIMELEGQVARLKEEMRLMKATVQQLLEATAKLGLKKRV